MHLILAGLLENVVRLACVEGYAGVLVDPAEVRAAIGEHMVGLSPSEAFAVMKVPKQTGWALADRRDDPSLRSIVIEGRDGRHRFCRFDNAEVTAFRSRFTTVVRVANAMDVQRHDVATRLKGAGVRPIISRREIGLDLYRVSDLPDFCTS